MKIKTILTLLFATTQFTFADDVPLSLSDANIAGWATGYTNYVPGTDVATIWQTPAKALEAAKGTSTDIVCLGRNGRITLTFSPAIINGSGYDFAVFENGFSDTFLELGWVEVSSDGTHFVRFPNSSLSENPVGGFGNVDPTKITGLASKYKQGLGTQFDLNFLKTFYEDQTNANPTLSLNPDFVNQLTNNFPFVDLNNIGYVRIIDIVGDGNAIDAYSHIIYDPYPTAGSAGFDLDAIAVLNQQSIIGESQSINFPEIPNQKAASGSIALSASASSGLPVVFSVQNDSASLNGNTLSFTTNGLVTVLAEQEGNATYAAAPPVLRSFYVAQNIQHIYLEPVPDQIAGEGTWQLHATASSGLPVYIEVSAGPIDTTINTNTLLLSLGADTGAVKLRATQSGNATYAPAADVFAEFKIVAATDLTAPKTFAQWSASLNLQADAQLDSDGDGVKNFQEYIMGTDPNNSSELPQCTLNSTTDAYGAAAFELEYSISQQTSGRTILQTAADLSSSWNDIIPEITSSQITTNAGQSMQTLQLQVPAESSYRFYRLLFKEQ